MKARNRLALSAMLVAIGHPVAGNGALTGRVMCNSRAPSDIVIQAFIEPNPLNQSVSFIIDSEGFYSSSVAELDGRPAREQKEVRFRMLPAGSYRCA